MEDAAAAKDSANEEGAGAAGDVAMGEGDDDTKRDKGAAGSASRATTDAGGESEAVKDKGTTLGDQKAEKEAIKEGKEATKDEKEVGNAEKADSAAEGANKTTVSLRVTDQCDRELGSACDRGVSALH